MLAKIPPKRGDARSSFRSLIAYVTRTDEAQAAGIETFTNCLSLETAHAEMRAVADRSARVRDPVFHFVISWREGEQPEPEQVFEAGRAALGALGMAPDAHQHVFAIHRDTGNVHLHVVVNRVSIGTGRAVHPGLSYLKLDRCMRELELRQGWQPDRGPYAVVERDGQPVIGRDRTHREVQPARPSRARDMEAFTGMESLATYVSGEPERDVLAALKRSDATWQDVHEALARHGLELRVKGQGLAIYAKDRDDLTPVKASSVHEQFGRGRLEKRLGPWVEPMRMIRVSNAGRRYVEREIDGTRTARREARAHMRAELRARYDREHTQQRREFDTARQQMRARHRDDYRALLERHQRVRERIRSSGMTSVERKAAYSVSAFERARELEVLRGQQWAEREALTRPQTYREWVGMMAQQGDEAAIAQIRGWAYAARRRRRKPEEPGRRNRITGLFGDDLDPLPPKRAQVLENWTWHVDTATGNVGYLREGTRQFTDEGWGVVFDSDGAQWDTMLAGLLLARQKFGPQIDVTGSEAFRERTAVLAVTCRIDVTFGDEALEARRLQLARAQRQREHVREAKGTRQNQRDNRSLEPKPESMPTPSADGPER
ncbi:TraI/MobA(P) family conjugative relaxase [Paraburkholderia kururiensis]|uniref:TraI/MobA(P) family conjugative relaxase n=1 Tax=Paraburkholderia kururiensis TaxID=984307 RepID=UPI0018F5083B|nr:TraI/MobA(P) family conjugative relaxase [Paraburkholderia kururiensis]